MRVIFVAVALTLWVAGSAGMPPVASHLSKLRADGRRLVDESGRPFIWRGITGFRAVELVATGRPADADAFFAWAHSQDASVVRVFAMSANLFRLTPGDGAAALAKTLELAARHGLYLEVVGLVDTASFQFDQRTHIRTMGATCAEWPNCLIEIANEPRHPTQDSRVGDPAYLRELRSLIPRSVPVALGSAHGGDDESPDFAGADYVTVHGNRADDDSPADPSDRAGWRWVSRIAAQGALSERTGKFVVNDEPRRDDLAAGKHLAVALLCRVWGVGDTFHYSGGLQAQVATGAELAALAARRRGWSAIPPDFSGSPREIGAGNAPVRSADSSTVIHAYSAVRARDGYVLAIGAAPSAPRVQWSDSWPKRHVVLSEAGVTLWKVSR
jgi:hypothetical protein